MPMVRSDFTDTVYLKAKEKFKSIITDIKDCRKRGQPVLVGTTSIEVSEYLSNLLEQENIPHQVLNAKFHQKEAEIIAQAGRPGTVTIATNMAGRGTDIVLGGNLEAELEALENKEEANITSVRKEWQKRHDQVVASGGLHIIGTERHESRRIDNQLRGRAGRQGDPGSSRFYLSLEDNLMRIFASDRISSIMQKFGMEENEAIESPLVSRAIENAQRKVEGHNFDIRKHLLEFDDVVNDQRKVIYQQRNELLEEEDIGETVIAMRHDVVAATIDKYIPPGSIDEVWDALGLTDAMSHDFGVPMNVAGWLASDNSIDEEALRGKIIDQFDDFMRQKEQLVGPDIMRRLEKQVMLDILDRYWKEHLIALDHLRQGIHLRSYAAKNPKQEYKREAFEMFVIMLDNIKHDVVRFLSRVQVRAEADLGEAEQQQRRSVKMTFNHPAAPDSLSSKAAESDAGSAPFIRGQRKIGRNEPCPCGSGKKYKHCHGTLS